MSRFGVFSLLLVLFSDLGRPSTAACSHIHDKLKVHEEDESGVRDKSQPIFRDLLSPFLTGLASEDGIIGRLFYNNDEFEKENPNEAEETSFRNPLEQLFVAPHFGHRSTAKKTPNKTQQSGGKEKSKKIEENKHYPTMMQNIFERVISSPSFCKYVQNSLRKLIEFTA